MKNLFALFALTVSVSAFAQSNPLDADVAFATIKKFALNSNHFEGLQIRKATISLNATDKAVEFSVVGIANGARSGKNTILPIISQTPTQCGRRTVAVGSDGSTLTRIQVEEFVKNAGCEEPAFATTVTYSTEVQGQTLSSNLYGDALSPLVFQTMPVFGFSMN